MNNVSLFYALRFVHLWHKNLPNVLHDFFQYASNLHTINIRYAVSHNLYKSRVKTNTGKHYMVMVMVMHLYSAFSTWIYSNALYNTLWGTLLDCFMAQFTIFFYVTSRIHRCPQNRMSDARPQHRELHALLFTNSVWIL